MKQARYVQRSGEGFTFETQLQRNTLLMRTNMKNSPRLFEYDTLAGVSNLLTEPGNHTGMPKQNTMPLAHAGG